MTGLPVLGSVTRSWVEKYQAQLRSRLGALLGRCRGLFVVFIVVVVVQQPASRLLRQILG